MSESLPLEDLFRAVDTKDTQRFLGFLTPDATFRFGNGPTVSGRTAIGEAVARFFASIHALDHRLLATWKDTDSLVCQGDVTYTRHDGSAVTLPFVNLFRLRDSLIREYLIYIDATPLFAPQA